MPIDTKSVTVADLVQPVNRLLGSQEAAAECDADGVDLDRVGAQTRRQHAQFREDVLAIRIRNRVYS